MGVPPAIITRSISTSGLPVVLTTFGIVSVLAKMKIWSRACIVTLPLGMIVSPLRDMATTRKVISGFSWAYSWSVLPTSGDCLPIRRPIICIFPSARVTKSLAEARLISRTISCAALSSGWIKTSMPKSVGFKGALGRDSSSLRMRAITFSAPSRLLIIEAIIFTSSMLVTEIKMSASLTPVSTRSFAEVAFPSWVSTSKLSETLSRHSGSRSSTVTSCFSFDNTLARS